MGQMLRADEDMSKMEVAWWMMDVVVLVRAAAQRQHSNSPDLQIHETSFDSLASAFSVQPHRQPSAIISPSSSQSKIYASIDWQIQYIRLGTVGPCQLAQLVF